MEERKFVGIVCYCQGLACLNIIDNSASKSMSNIAKQTCGENFNFQSPFILSFA